MLAPIPASILNQTRPDLGIPNRFRLKSSRFSIEVGLARRSGSPRLHRSPTADAGSRLSGRSNLWNADGTNSDPGRFCTALPDPFPPSPGPGKCVSPVLRRGYFSDLSALLIGALYGFRWVR